MRKLNVLGVCFRDMSVRESMRLVTQFFANHRINVVYFLETEALLEVSAHDEMRGYIESMDLVSVTSPDILTAAGASNKARAREIETAQFQREIFERIKAEEASVFLLAETAEKAALLEQTLKNYAPDLRIVGSYALENLPGDDDHAINEINAQTPDILVSQMASPRHEQFICENRMKVNSRIWVAFQRFPMSKPLDGVKPNKLSRLVTKTLFKRIVSKYDKEKEE